MTITFGTSGHRGIINQNFTHDHVCAIALAIRDYINSQTTPPSPKIIIGYDPRFGNDPLCGETSFTKPLVETLLKAGISVEFSETFTPTPVISFAIPKRELAGGILLTASHNPPEYNGLKFNTANGAPASIEVTSYIEKKANQYLQSPTTLESKPGTFERVNLINEFVTHLFKTVETLIQKPLDGSEITLAVDVKHGACGTTWKQIQHQGHFKNLFCLNENPDPNFGNQNPNPTEKELSKLKQTIVENRCAMGIGNDPDGDRHAILDEKGEWVSPEQVTTIIAEYLHSTKNKINGIATTLASSALIKTWCSVNNVHYVETAVGFKHFTPHLEQAKTTHQRLLAVESSGGFSCSDHTLEKCGFLPGLLLLGISLQTQKPLSQLKNELIKKYGVFNFLEEIYTFSIEKKDILLPRLKTPKTDNLKRFFKSIASHSTLDGLKLTFTDQSWLLVRPSGTEPLIRIYAEAKQKDTAQSLIDACKIYLSNDEI